MDNFESSAELVLIISESQFQPETSLMKKVFDKNKYASILYL